MIALLMLTFLWNVQNRTNGFEHTVGTKDIIVPADGVYRVSYGLSITTTGTDRYTAIFTCECKRWQFRFML
ncbi:hypothetical protein [Nitrosarchaeum koreense]|uniref:hypothetical protein n=1 Tax=Nitrosarchaeum koreense TaxID=1088740 RepID=UPI00064E7BEF|nr:hypothetical protein [Nitrosarchaeum koreense]